MTSPIVNTIESVPAPRIKDGEVFHQIYRGNLTDEQLYAKISDTLTVLAQKANEIQESHIL